MGGSSAVNTCIALRGQPYDYDEWAERGAEGWGFRDCLPAFKRLERDMDFASEWHGVTPPIATDARGRVRGVSGLYVADASLMPTIPSANTNLACLMIGERFGEWLREGAI